ncbi:MAG: ABC transporter ATP-binding protein [Planctomycetota bacterium]|nr:MAG: ABC transporter ATP-binding protein [Planctomycetota bacterium]
MTESKATNEPKVRIRGLSKAFRDNGHAGVEVLDNVDLDVRAGEFMCLLGPSGCGKSTLLNVLGGFERFDAGTVAIDGAPVAGPDPRRVFVFQEYGIFPWMSVWDNIAFGLASRSSDDKHRITDHYIELVGLKGFERTFPQQLSGGMRQRVAVARALAVDPDILYMDEPFAAVDSLTRLKLRSELIRIWQQEKKTILFVTHDIDESAQLAQRVVVMSTRPARIKTIVDLSDLPYPRDIDSPEYIRARDRLFAEMGVSTRV